MGTHVPEFTGRYRAHYQAAGVTHAITIRATLGTSLSSIISSGRDACHDIFNAVAAHLADDFTWISAEVADEGSNSFAPATVPAAVTGLVDFAGDNWSPARRVSFVHLSGRAAGSRTGVMMFGLEVGGDFNIDRGADGIVTDSELPGIAAAAGVLSSHAAAGNGLSAAFYTRGTYKVHDRLLKLVRRGLIS